MEQLVSHLAQQIKQNALSNKAFLLGLSGGLDSCVLLALFVKLRQIVPHLSFRAIHIHHGISPNADSWLAHCQQLCAVNNVPFLSQKVRLDSVKNLEAQARTVRYQAMQTVLADNEVVVTAHHLDDQTETFLLALKRGSGVKGLSAMSVLSSPFNFTIFRPLLNVSRAELEQYATAQQLTFVTDESNNDLALDRNFLRHQVLPILRERWPHIDHSIQRTAQHCQQQEQLLAELLAETLQQHLTADNQFNLTSFTQYSVAKQRQLLRYWLAHLQQPMPTQTQLDSLLDTVVYARQDAIPQLKLHHKVVRRYQQQLYLTDDFIDLTSYQAELKEAQMLLLPDHLGHIQWRKQDNCLLIQWNEQYSELRLPQANEKVMVRFHYSGKVRTRQNGMQQDIKKVWQQCHIPPWQRKRVPLIFYAEQFQCAVGLFKHFVK